MELLPFLSNDYDSTYEDLKSLVFQIRISGERERALRIEIYKNLKKLNLGYMNGIFKFRPTNKLVKNVNLTWKFENPIKPVLEQEA